MRWARAALLLLLAGCAHQDPGPTLPEGRVAARFERLDGTPLSLAALRGKVVLVTVITTWNDLALLEVPLLKELHEAHAPELQIVCVALDEDPTMLDIFARTFAVPYLVVRAHDPQRFTGDSGPFGPIGVIPTSVLLDRDGRVAARNDGTWAPDILRSAVQRLLAAK